MMLMQNALLGRVHSQMEYVTVQDSTFGNDSQTRSSIRGMSALVFVSSGTTEPSTYRPLSRGEEVQSSIVTIFSIWNSMMGVSILSMPWGLYQAGFGFGLLLLVAVGMIISYTAYLITLSKNKLDPGKPMLYDFPDICRSLYGRPGEILAVSFSIFVLIGAVLAYWVLMSNFLYFTGILFYVHCEMDIGSLPLRNLSTSPTIFGSTFAEVWQLRVSTILLYQKTIMFFFCNPPATKEIATNPIYVKHLHYFQRSVPIYLAVLVFPFLNFKSPTVFTKFTALGTVSVLYLIGFNTIQLVKCGPHWNFINDTSPHYIEQFKWHFPAFTGLLTMSFFIHNSILTILGCQRHPENNTRDLSIGYALVGMSYIAISVTFYIAFPFPRSCILDNLLNNFDDSYLPSSVARVLIFFQMFSIFPLIMYLIRSQISCLLYNNPWPGIVFVLLLNTIIVSLAVLTAVFYPKVGSIVRYFGAVSGMVLIYALPCLVYMKLSSRAFELSTPKVIFHSSIIVFGVANLLAQFLV
ncbi:hypothetical protein Angca_005888 [Angiostrongylus cantonensis]|nr:hypothetical protein Angca_005888 [Angiostrongylus cantonensis]